MSSSSTDKAALQNLRRHPNVHTVFYNPGILDEKMDEKMLMRSSEKSAEEKELKTKRDRIRAELIFDSCELGSRIASYLLYHGPMKWTPQSHFVADGCGQSCGCCRSRNNEDLGGCEICEMGWTMSCVSRSCLSLTNKYAAEHERLHMHCSCGQCRDEWLKRGWICPGLYHLLEN